MTKTVTYEKSTMTRFAVKRARHVWLNPDKTSSFIYCKTRLTTLDCAWTLPIFRKSPSSSAADLRIWISGSQFETWQHCMLSSILIHAHSLLTYAFCIVLLNPAWPSRDELNELCISRLHFRDPPQQKYRVRYVVLNQ